MSGIRESLGVRMLGENEELIKELESEVNKHYDLICKEIWKHAQFQRLIQNFKSDAADTSFSKLFTRAFICTENNSEIYHAIRKIFFKMMYTCQQVVICLNSTVRAIETVTITLVSLYKYLHKNKQEAANRIFTHIKEFQSQNINVLVSDAVKESQNLISFIEEIKSRNSEHEINDKLYKLLQPVKIMHFCLVELSNTNYYMDMYYNILQDALFGDSFTKVDVDGDTTWKNSTTKKLFLKYFGSILATRLVCTQFIKGIETVRDNFQEMIHCLPIVT